MAKKLASRAQNATKELPSPLRGVLNEFADYLVERRR